MVNILKLAMAIGRPKVPCRWLATVGGRTYNINASDTGKGVVLVAGAGNGCGSAVAKRFALAGYTACVLRRHADKLRPLVDDINAAGGTCLPFGVDCRKEDKVKEVIGYIENTVGPIEVAVHNIGANVQFGILETTVQKYHKVWEMACLSGFLVGRETAKYMVPRQKGTIIFTGATASIRGGKGFAAFAGAKHGLRALSQSMARELGEKGIHVAHVIVDGAIDTPWIKQMIGEKYESLLKADGLLMPEAIAETYYDIHMQHRSCWTHEIDVRPWMEKW